MDIVDTKGIEKIEVSEPKVEEVVEKKRKQRSKSVVELVQIRPKRKLVLTHPKSEQKHLRRKGADLRAVRNSRENLSLN